MDSVEYLPLGILTLSLLCHSVQASVFLCPVPSLLALHLSLTLSVSPSPSIALHRPLCHSHYLYFRLSLPLLLSSFSSFASIHASRFIHFYLYYFLLTNSACPCMPLPHCMCFSVPACLPGSTGGGGVPETWEFFQSDDGPPTTGTERKLSLFATVKGFLSFYSLRRQRRLLI